MKVLKEDEKEIFEHGSNKSTRKEMSLMSMF